MVPGVIVPPLRAFEQGARVRWAPGARDHTRHDEQVGGGAGTESVQGAARYLHPGLEDAEQGVEDRGGEAEGAGGPQAGQGKVAKRLAPFAALVPRSGKEECLLGAARGAARRLTRRQASVPRATLEADRVLTVPAQLLLPGVGRCGGGIPDEVVEDAG